MQFDYRMYWYHELWIAKCGGSKFGAQSMVCKVWDTKCEVQSMGAQMDKPVLCVYLIKLGIFYL